MFCSGCYEYSDNTTTLTYISANSSDTVYLETSSERITGKEYTEIYTFSNSSSYYCDTFYYKIVKDTLLGRVTYDSRGITYKGINPLGDMYVPIFIPGHLAGKRLNNFQDSVLKPEFK